MLDKGKFFPCQWIAKKIAILKNRMDWLKWKEFIKLQC